jgi:phage terminase large subunit-like protein
MTALEIRSLAEIVAEMNEEERAAIFADFTDAEFEQLQYDWSFWGRPKQFVPEGSFIHLALAGRGFGKTRAGAEFVRDRAMRYPGCRIALVGRAARDTSQTIIYGESGIMNVCAPDERPIHKIVSNKLIWPNGSTAETYSSQEPSQLRGPQFHFALADELGSWLHTRDDSGLNAWANLKIATRLEYISGGLQSDPQIFVATTPKRTETITDILERYEKKPGSVSLTRGSTYENKANLSAMQLEELTEMYEGTDVGRQELLGEMLGDAEGVLWTQSVIDDNRDFSNEMPQLPIRVIAVDPSVAENPTDECGIIVIGATNHRHLHKRHAYVLEDATIKGPPQVWAKVVADLAVKYNAPVVVERNQGGALVPMAVHGENPNIKIHTVWAGTGKATRAEPAVIRYQNKHVHHWGYHPMLETQMITFDPENMKKSPDRVDALVWGIFATLIEPPPGLFPRKIRAKSAQGRLPTGIGTGLNK